MIFIFSLEGKLQVIKELQNLENASEAFCEALVEETAEDIRMHSSEIVPKRFGFLHSALRKTVTGLKAEVGYDPTVYNYIKGKSVGAYMMDVHEDLSVYHADGTYAKFLELPVLAVMQDFESRAQRLWARFVGRH